MPHAQCPYLFYTIVTVIINHMMKHIQILRFFVLHCPDAFLAYPRDANNAAFIPSTPSSSRPRTSLPPPPLRTSPHHRPTAARHLPRPRGKLMDRPNRWPPHLFLIEQPLAFSWSRCIVLRFAGRATFDLGQSRLVSRTDLV